MGARRRAQVGYRYGRMCLRIEAAGRRIAIRVAAALAAGLIVGWVLAWAILPHLRHETYAECILAHMPGSGSRAAAAWIRDACLQSTGER